MAQVRIETSTGHRYIKKAKSLEMTPYFYDSTLRRLILGEDTYDIYAIIGDTIEITYDKGDETIKENEFVNTPVLANFSRGNITFSAECLDMQNTVLKAMFSASTGVDRNNRVLANAMLDDYPYLFFCIRVSFHDSRLQDIVLPMVQMANYYAMNEMKSGIVRCNLYGIAMNHRVCVFDNELFAMQNGDIYMPNTPLIFVEHNADFGLFHHTDNETDDVFFTRYSDREQICTQATITAIPDNEDSGTVSGGGTYPVGTTITLHAYDMTSDEGFTGLFSQWSDGVQSDTRQIVVSRDATYVAEFDEMYVVTVHVNNTDAGHVLAEGNFVRRTEGDGYFKLYYRKNMPSGQIRTLTLNASSYPNYYFDTWEDGTTSVLRQRIIINSDIEFTANFGKYITINVVSDTPECSVSGGATSLRSGETLSISATAAENYRFASWSDGNTEASREITVGDNDATYVAQFIRQYTVTVLADDEEQGTTHGSGTYDVGTAVTIEAVPNRGYVFDSWNDGNTDNPRIVIANDDMTFSAAFVDARVVLTIDIKDTIEGTATGAGTYAAGDIVEIEAIPNEGYAFDSWDLGAGRVSYSNPYSITMPSNVAGVIVIANFRRI